MLNKDEHAVSLHSLITTSVPASEGAQPAPSSSSPSSDDAIDAPVGAIRPPGDFALDVVAGT